ncbi:MAG TPA: hypothetical protein VFX86_00255 [Candidatus Saccharimonadales bacterium]|nr:hypothetical protein [Candidatus Saccharimonadales bacterium]
MVENKHAPLTPETLDVEHADLAAPNAHAFITDYVEAGSVVPLANFDLSKDEGTKLVGDGEVARLVSSQQEAELFEAMREAAETYGKENISDGPAYDRKRGVARDDSLARGFIGIYVTREAFDGAKSKGVDSPFAERPAVEPPRYGRVRSKVKETHGNLRHNIWRRTRHWRLPRLTDL